MRWRGAGGQMSAVTLDTIGTSRTNLKIGSVCKERINHILKPFFPTCYDPVD